MAFTVSIGSESVRGGSSKEELDEDDDLQRAYNKLLKECTKCERLSRLSLKKLIKT